MRSRYDELYDRYYSLLSSKAGTRYERLAAVVFKHLDTSQAVIHDLKLRGASGVAHQIDVVIEREGQLRHILVECKDFDVSGKNVGLGIVRDFYGVVEDVGPDEAYVVTCVGFTRYARKYAKSKCIKLAILRQFSEADWEGRARMAVVDFIFVTATRPKPKIRFKRRQDFEKFQEHLATAGITGGRIRKRQPVYINTPTGRFQINEFLDKNTDHTVHAQPGPVTKEIDVADKTIEVENRGPIELSSLKIEYEVSHVEETFEVGGEEIAELLLQGVGDEDLVIVDKDLKRFRIDSGTGEVSG